MLAIARRPGDVQHGYLQLLRRTRTATLSHQSLSTVFAFHCVRYLGARYLQYIRQPPRPAAFPSQPSTLVRPLHGACASRQRGISSPSARSMSDAGFCAMRFLLTRGSFDNPERCFQVSSRRSAPRHALFNRPPANLLGDNVPEQRLRGDEDMLCGRLPFRNSGQQSMDAMGITSRGEPG